jgi:PTS system mannose-specific IIA component
MVGIVLVTHGKLGQELLRTAEGIVGPVAGARSVSIEPQDGMEQIREKMAQAIGEVDGGDGVLVLTDMFGGTPANLALTFLDERRVEVVTGVNLPMMLKLGTTRDDPAPRRGRGRRRRRRQKNIVFASELLGGAAGRGPAG